MTQEILEEVHESISKEELNQQSATTGRRPAVAATKVRNELRISGDRLATITASTAKSMASAEAGNRRAEGICSCADQNGVSARYGQQFILENDNDSDSTKTELEEMEMDQLTDSEDTAYHKGSSYYSVGSSPAHRHFVCLRLCLRAKKQCSGFLKKSLARVGHEKRAPKSPTYGDERKEVSLNQAIFFGKTSTDKVSQPSSKNNPLFSLGGVSTACVCDNKA